LRIEFKNNLIHTSATETDPGGQPSAPIVLEGDRPDRPQQGGVHFNNDVVVQTRPGPAVLVEGPWPSPNGNADDQGQPTSSAAASFKGWSDIHGEVRVINPYGVSMEKRVPVKNFTLSVTKPPHERMLRKTIKAYIPLQPSHAAEIEELSFAATDRVTAHIRSRLVERPIDVRATVNVDGTTLAEKDYELSPGENWYPEFTLARPLQEGTQVELKIAFHTPGEGTDDAVELDFQPRTATRSLDIGQQQRVPYIEGGISIDGDLSDWAHSPKISLDKSDLQEAIETKGLTQAQIYTGWDEQFLYLAVEVHDDEHHNQQTGSEIWDGDAIQFAVAPFPAEFEFFNFGLALASGQARTHQFAGPETDALKHSDYAVVRDEQNDRTYYEMRVPLEQLTLDSRAGVIFGFNLIVFEDSGETEGHEYWMELAPGLAGGRDRDAFKPFLLEK
jgi:hypothetical protein